MILQARHRVAHEQGKMKIIDTWREREGERGHTHREGGGRGMQRQGVWSTFGRQKERKSG